MEGIGGQIFEIAQGLLLAAVLLLILPFKHTTRITSSRLLKNTTRQAVWDRLVDIPDFTPDTRPDDPLLPDTLAGYKKVSEEPLIHEIIFDLSKGQRATLKTMRTRALVNEPPHRNVSTIETLDGVAAPVGADATFESRFEDVPGGVRYVQLHVLKTGTLLQDLATRQAYFKRANRIARYFNSGWKLAPAPWWQAYAVPLILSAVTFGTAALAFGWAAAAIGIALLLIHEFGHWSAMRLAGYRHARMTLVPFFGGIASAGEPYRSQWHAALCVLMGPGLSAALCGLALIAANLLGAPPEPNRILLEGAAPHAPWAPFVLRLGAEIGALLNIFQMLPVLPLDGGHLLRLLIRSDRNAVARSVSLGLGAAAVGLAIWWQAYLLAPVALIGMVILAQATPAQSAIPDMTGRQRLIILASTLATLGLLLATMTPFLAKLGGYRSPRAAVAYLTGHRHAMPGADGSAKITPRFAVHAPLLDAIYPRIWVSGGDGKRLRSEWRLWGYPIDDGVNATLEISETAEATNRIETLAGLRDHIEYIVNDSDVAVTFPGAPDILFTRRGPAALQPFQAKSEELDKSCLGFGAFQQSGRSFLTGYICAASGSTARREDVACLVDGLTFDGEAPGAAVPASCAPAAAAASQ